VLSGSLDMCCVMSIGFFQIQSVAVNVLICQLLMVDGGDALSLVLGRG
jgi:hypothetical protein